MNDLIFLQQCFLSFFVFTLGLIPTQVLAHQIIKTNRLEQMTQGVSDISLENRHEQITQRDLAELSIAYPHLASNFQTQEPHIWIMGYPLRRADLLFSEVLTNLAIAFSDASDQDYFFKRDDFFEHDDFLALLETLDIRGYEESINTQLTRAEYSTEAVKNFLELLSVSGSLFEKSDKKLSDFLKSTQPILALFQSKNIQGTALHTLLDAHSNSITRTIFWETLNLANYLEATRIYQGLYEVVADQYPLIGKNLAGKGAGNVNRIPLLSKKAANILARYDLTLNTDASRIKNLLRFLESLEYALEVDLPTKATGESNADFARRLWVKKHRATKNFNNEIFFEILMLATHHNDQELFNKCTLLLLVSKARTSDSEESIATEALSLSNAYNAFKINAEENNQENQNCSNWASIMTVYDNNKQLLNELYKIKLEYLYATCCP